ncbi:MAG: FAD-binding oxidoreductase, partial [Merismopedia sp. SIO2A8]|nr:FAD-binding oxidoreductase [Merismopedia sp. SIO2A8]
WVQRGDRITGVVTTNGVLSSQNIVVCAGGWTRQLLQNVNLSIRQYFTHSESIEGFCSHVQLKTLVMPATMQRIILEAEASTPPYYPSWDTLGQEILPHILDAGVIQFKNGLIRMGQISRVLPDPAAKISAAHGEQEIRTQIGHILPSLKTMKGQWHHCLVAFTGDGLPLIGPLAQLQGLYLFSGFSSPFALVPSLAQRFAVHLIGGQSDAAIEQMTPERPSLVMPRD